MHVLDRVVVDAIPNSLLDCQASTRNSICCAGVGSLHHAARAMRHQASMFEAEITCRKCGRVAAPGEFKVDKNLLRGHTTTCKTCHNAEVKIYYEGKAGDEDFASRQRQAKAKHEKKKMQDPAYRGAKRVANRNRMRRLNDCPEYRAAKNARNRDRYHALPLAEKQRLAADTTAKRKLRRQTDPEYAEKQRVDTKRRKRKRLESKRLALLEATDYKCRYCLTDLTAKNSEIDHILPSSRGGKTELANLQAICRYCNRRKGDKTDVEFVAWLAEIEVAA